MKITMASKNKSSNVTYKEGLALGIKGFFFGIYISFRGIIWKDKEGRDMKINFISNIDKFQKGLIVNSEIRPMIGDTIIHRDLLWEITSVQLEFNKDSFFKEIECIKAYCDIPRSFIRNNTYSEEIVDMYLR
jgi:hypothetical protein